MSTPASSTEMPSVETASQTALVRTCRRCLREGRDATVDDPTLDDCPRCHSVLKGNSRRRTHGMRSRPEMHPDTAALFLASVNAILADSGCDTASHPPSYVFASQAQDYVRTEMLIETGFAAVGHHEGAGGP